jgi:hypothetical protein
VIERSPTLPTRPNYPTQHYPPVGPGTLGRYAANPFPIRLSIPTTYAGFGVSRRHRERRRGERWPPRTTQRNAGLIVAQTLARHGRHSCPVEHGTSHTYPASTSIRLVGREDSTQVEVNMDHPFVNMCTKEEIDANRMSLEVYARIDAGCPSRFTFGPTSITPHLEVGRTLPDVAPFPETKRDENSCGSVAARPRFPTSKKRSSSPLEWFCSQPLGGRKAALHCRQGRVWADRSFRRRQ